MMHLNEAIYNGLCDYSTMRAYPSPLSGANDGCTLLTTFGRPGLLKFYMFYVSATSRPRATPLCARLHCQAVYDIETRRG